MGRPTGIANAAPVCPVAPVEELPTDAATDNETRWRVARGGLFYVPTRICSSITRTRYPRDHGDITTGVRPILDVRLVD